MLGSITFVVVGLLLALNKWLGLRDILHSVDDVNSGVVFLFLLCDTRTSEFSIILRNFYIAIA